MGYISGQEYQWVKLIGYFLMGSVQLILVRAKVFPQTFNPITSNQLSILYCCLQVMDCAGVEMEKPKFKVSSAWSPFHSTIKFILPVTCKTSVLILPAPQSQTPLHLLFLLPLVLSSQWCWEGNISPLSLLHSQG